MAGIEKDLKYLADLKEQLSKSQDPEVTPILHFVSDVLTSNSVKIDDLKKQVLQTVEDTNNLVSYFGDKLEDRSPTELFKLFSEFASDVLSTNRSLQL